MREILENKSVKVLVVDDENKFHKRVAKFLKEDGFSEDNLYSAYDKNGVFEKLKERYFDVVLLDINMTKTSGIDILREMRSEGYDVPVIMITNMDAWKEAFEGGADMYVKKDNKEKELVPKIQTVVLRYLKSYGFWNQRYFLHHFKSDCSYVAIMRISNMNQLIEAFGWRYYLRILDGIKNKVEKTEHNLFYNEKEQYFIFSPSKPMSEEVIKDFEKSVEYIVIDGVKIFLQWETQLPKNHEEKKQETNGGNCEKVLNEIIDKDKREEKRKKTIDKGKILTHAFSEENGWKIVPYFQPIRDFNDDVTKFEVLARVVNNSLGKNESIYPYLQPLRIIGREHDLTKIIIHKGIEKFRQSPFFKGKETRCDLSFNITDEDLKRGKSFFDFLEEERKGPKNSEGKFEKEIPRARITLEILERDGLDDDSLYQLQRLEMAGYKIAIDDFGAERSSFDKITRIGRDVIVKIDGQFIKDIKSNKRHQKIVRSIAKVADELGFLTIAEYVEDQTVKEMLRDYGINLFQGYYDGGMPVPSPRHPGVRQSRYVERKKPLR